MPRLLPTILFLLLAGCEDTPPVPQSLPGPQPDAGTQFDPHTASTIHGQVEWRGARPIVPPLRSIENPLTDKPPPPPRDWPNPNAPVLTKDGGTVGAVVFLRGIDARRGKRWDHPPVKIELKDQLFQLSTGKRIAFVRAGDSVELASREAIYHTVQARGGAFFALTLPTPELARSRVLSTPGVVELASGAGYFWMRAYLFVDHHPYYTLTDENGRFSLRDVPPGAYELVAWHPNWRVSREERNHESIRIQQVRFEEPLVAKRKVLVEERRPTLADLQLWQGGHDPK